MCILLMNVLNSIYRLRPTCSLPTHEGKSTYFAISGLFTYYFSISFTYFSKPSILLFEPMFSFLFQLMSLVQHKPRTIQLQEILFITAFYEKLRRSQEGTGSCQYLLNNQFFIHLQSAMDMVIAKWLEKQGK